MSNLILDSLEIRNFRGLKELRIEKLGRVNLIVGKNNVGKTSVLEALRLYAQPASLRTTASSAAPNATANASRAGATGEEPGSAWDRAASAMATATGG